MLDHASALPDGLSVRPAHHNDEPFLQSLYSSARPDLQYIDGDADLIESIVLQQYNVMQTGTGINYPDAVHYVIEKASGQVGAMIIDFGPNEIRVVYLAFIPLARGLGYGRAVLQGVQQAATRVQCPVATVVWLSNTRAKQHYLSLGFKVDEVGPGAERMVWYPGTPTCAA